MSSKYHTVFSGGDFCADNRRMYIRLYPNTSNTPANKVQDSNSTLNQAIKSACDQLLNYGAINYYAIKRFHADDLDYYYPCVDTEGNIGGQLEGYLTGNTDEACSPYPNGTGDDLLSLTGAHLLVHNNDCTTGYVSAGSGDKCDQSAFGNGRLCWTSAACTDNTKTKAGAIQEPLHQFIMNEQSQVNDLLQENEDGEKDEHSLGRVNDNENMTPMLAFHAYNFSRSNTCNGSTMDIGYNYSSDLTSCTKQAVEYIANDSQCNDIETYDGIC